MISFDEATHTYTESGQVIPSVTQILSTEGLVSYFNTDPWYMERGTAIHKACEYFDKGTLDWDSLDPAILGFVKAYVLFMVSSGLLFSHIEEPLYHPIYHYAGTPDRFLPLLDIKGVQGCELQLEAYGELLRANKIHPGREAYTLHLKEDGTYKLASYKFNRTKLGVFLSAVTLYNYKRSLKNGKC